MRKIFNKETWKKIKAKGAKLNKNTIMMALVGLVLVGSGAVLINNYFGAGVSPLSDYLKIQTSGSYGGLTPSWQESDPSSNVKISLGNYQGKEVKWWIAGRQNALGDGTIAYEGNEDLESSYPYMTLLATEPVVENQVFNTYLDERPSAIEEYNDATKYPNSYITSSIRAYFNRNQGGYPGTYSSMTGKKDGSSDSTNSDFENQYFPDWFRREIDNFIVPQNASVSGNGYTDRYYLLGGSSNNVTWHPTSDSSNSIYNVPAAYLPGNQAIWLRTPSSNSKQANVFSSGSVYSANVVAHNSYLPVMSINLDDFTDYFSLAQGSSKDYVDGKDGSIKLKQISNDGGITENNKNSVKTFYVKSQPGELYEADINAPSSILSNSKLRVPYTSYVSEAYMVLYLKSKETDKYKTNEQDKTTGEYITKDATFYSVAKIPSGENGVAEFDMSDVPASGYEAYAWIELTKEDGMTYISNPASFTVIRGHDVLFRETEGVKFLDEYGNEITETRSLKDLSNPNPPPSTGGTSSGSGNTSSSTGGGSSSSSTDGTSSGDGNTSSSTDGTSSGSGSATYNYKVAATKNNLEYTFIMQVEDIYNKNILAPTFGIINNSTTQSIEVIGAYTENPGQNPNATNVLQAGGISQPATYWKFRLSKEQTKGNGTNPSGMLIAIRTPKLTPNTYTFKLAKKFGENSDTDFNFELKQTNENGDATKESQIYSHGATARFELTTAPAYKDEIYTVKAVNKAWVNEDETEIKSEYLTKFDALPTLSLVKEGTKNIRRFTIQSDTLIWIENAQLKEEQVTFLGYSGDADGKDKVDLKNAAKVIINGTSNEEAGEYNETENNVVTASGYKTNVNFGSELKFTLELKDETTVSKEDGVTADFQDINGNTLKSNVTPDVDSKYTFTYNGDQGNEIRKPYKVIIKGLEASTNDVIFSPESSDKIEIAAVGGDRNKAVPDKWNYGTQYEFGIYFKDGYYKNYASIDKDKITINAYKKDSGKGDYKKNGNGTYEYVGEKQGNYVKEETSTYGVSVVGQKGTTNIADSYAKVTVGVGDDLNPIKIGGLEFEIVVNDEDLELNEYTVKFGIDNLTGENKTEIYENLFYEVSNDTNAQSMIFKDVGDGNGDYTQSGTTYKYVGPNLGNYTRKDVDEGTAGSAKYLPKLDAAESTTINNTTITHGTKKYFALKTESKSVDFFSQLSINCVSDFESPYTNGDVAKFTLLKDQNDKAAINNDVAIYVLEEVKADAQVNFAPEGTVLMTISPEVRGELNLDDALDIEIGTTDKGSSNYTELGYTNINGRLTGVAVPKGKKTVIRVAKSENAAYTNLKLDEMLIVWNNTVSTYVATSTDNGKTYYYWAIYVEPQQSNQIDLKVSGIDINRYTIALPTVDGVSWDIKEGKIENIAHGSNVTITMNLSDGYKFDTNQGDNPFKYFDANNQEISDIAGTINVTHAPDSEPTSYTLKLTGVKSDFTLGVLKNFVKLDVRTVSIHIPEKDFKYIKIKSKTSSDIGTAGTETVNNGEVIYNWNIKYGNSFMFSLELNDAPWTAENISIKEGNSNETGNLLVPANGVYTVENVVSNKDIYITTGLYSSYAVLFSMEDPDIRITDAIEIYKNNPDKEGAEEDTIITQGGAMVQHGGTLKFRVKTKEKYNKSVPIAKVVRDDGETILRQEFDSAKNEYYFILDTVIKPTTITISEVNVNKYDLLFSGENVSFFDNNSTNLTESGQVVQYGDSFEFTIIADSGYDVSTAEVSLSGYHGEPGSDDNPIKATVTAIDKSKGRYKVEDVKQDVTIKVTNVRPSSYTITFKEVGDLVYNGDTKFIVKNGEDTLKDNSIKVNYADPKNFKIELDEKYNKSSISLRLSDESKGKITEVSNQEQAPGHFEYKIYATDDVDVYIQNLQVNNYSIKFEGNDNSMELYEETQNIPIDLSKDITVVHGKPYSFRVKANTGYNLQTSILKIDGTEITPEVIGQYLKYTINDVTKDTTLTLEPLKKLKYSLKFEGSNVTFDGDSIAENTVSDLEYGSDYEFTIKPDDGYNLNSLTEDSVKTNNGISVTKVKENDDGSYTYKVSDITADTTVIVKDVKPNEYKVTFNGDNVNEEAVTIYDESGNNITSEGIAVHGSDFKFRIEKKDAYSKSNVTVELKGNSGNSADSKELTLSEDGYYTVNQDKIKGKIEITIKGLERNKYIIGFSGSGFIVKDTGGEDIEDYSIQHEIGEYEFRVYADAENGFKLNSDTIRVYSSNGTIVETATEGEGAGLYKSYTISHVTTDTTVYIEGLKSEFYELKFEDNLGGTTGFKIKNAENNNDITSGVYLKLGTTIKFKVELDEGYSNSVPALEIEDTVSGNNLTYDATTKTGSFTQNKSVSDTIKLTNLAINEYNVTLTSGTGFTYTTVDDKVIPGGITVQHNVGQIDGKNKYSFKIKAENGYDVSGANVNATNATVEISEKTATEIIVTLTNVTSDTNVTVTDISLNLYDVKFVTAEGSEGSLENLTIRTTNGREITNGTTAYYNKPLDFKIELHEGYTDSTLELYSGGTQITKNENNVYSIDIQSNVTITIKNLKLNEYSVLVSPDSNNVDCGNITINDSSFNENNEVDLGKHKHGGDLSFDVKAKAGYTVKDIKVNASNADVTLTYDETKGTMTVTLSNLVGVVKDSNDKKYVKVEISDVKKNRYKVSFTGVENASILGDVVTSDSSSVNYKNITSTGKEVPYGSKLRFQIKPNSGYENAFKDMTNPAVVAKVGDKTLIWNTEGATDLSGAYIETDAIESDTVVKIEGIVPNTYKITFPQESSVEFYNFTQSSAITEASVTHGSFIRFKVRPKAGYNLSKMGITSSVGELVEESRSDSEAVYKLSDVTSDGVIKVTIDKTKVELKFEEGEGYSYQTDSGEELKGIAILNYGDSYSFAVKVQDGYDPDTLKVYQEETEVTNSGADGNVRKFTVNNVTESATIKSSVNKMKYDIKFKSVEGVSYYENDVMVDSSSMIRAEYGGSVQFSLKLDSKYNQSSVTVYANGREVSLINGVYTVTNISENIEITVEGVQLNQYKINLSKSEGIQYNIISEGSTVTQDSGVYVREHGGSISFSITPTEGYQTSNMVVTVRDSNGVTKSLTPSAGKYTISNITEDKTVFVADAARIQYNVKITPTAGVTYMNDSGAVIEGSVNVTHGSNFEFTISLNRAYDESVPVVVSTGKTGVKKLETGKYMVSNVTEDMTITVNNVVKNTYTVALTGITGVYYKDAGGKTISDHQTVGYSDDFAFKVGLHAAYTDSEISVMVGNENVSPEDDGFYRIKGIIENKTVTVIGVKENVEVDLINTINGLPDTVKDATDVSAVVSATRTYNALPQEKQANVTNAEKLFSLQQQSGAIAHTTNDITVSGVDWNIKLVAVPLSSSTGEHERIYDQLNNEFILSLYDIYLVDMLSDKKYDLPEGQKVVITIPTPDLTYFENPFIVHEKSSDGKLEYLLMTRNGDRTSFEMTSFSPVGMAATKVLNTGYSSLYEEFGGGMESIKDGIYDIMQTGVNVKGKNTKSGTKTGETSSNGLNSDSQGASDAVSSDVNGTFAQSNSNSKGSALRLLLVMILGFSITGIVTVIMKKNEGKN